MNCQVYKQLHREWRWLIHHKNGNDSMTVELYWKMAEHRSACEVCRDEDIALGIGRMSAPSTRSLNAFAENSIEQSRPVYEVDVMSRKLPPFFCPVCENELSYIYDARTGRYMPDQCCRDQGWR